MRIFRLISQFLVFSAGASPEILKACPQSERIKFGSVGAIVCTTGVVASLSSFYAFELLTKNWLWSLILSLGWGTLIYNLDRYLVSSIRKNGNIQVEWLQAAPRLILAAGLALVISRPLELRLFEQEIAFQLAAEQRMEVQRVESTFQLMLDKVGTEIAENQRVLRGFLDRREAYYQEYRCECDGTCGTGVRGGGTECNRKKAKYEAASREYEGQRRDILQREEGLQGKIKEIEKEKELTRKQVESAFSFGLFSQFRALSNLPGNSWLGIWALFFMLESLPVLTKLFAARGPYDLLLEEKEYGYRLQLLQTVEKGEETLHRGRQLHALETEIQLKEKELELYARIKARAILRMEQLRTDLHFKLLRNPESDSPGETQEDL